MNVHVWLNVRDDDDRPVIKISAIEEADLEEVVLARLSVFPDIGPADEAIPEYLDQVDLDEFTKAFAFISDIVRCKNEANKEKLKARKRMMEDAEASE